MTHFLCNRLPLNQNNIEQLVPSPGDNPIKNSLTKILKVQHTIFNEGLLVITSNQESLLRTHTIV
jgi:hypothetical protein